MDKDDLIEPYWNVKTTLMNFVNSWLGDLIEPYWNVKVKGASKELDRYYRFNRTILECKAEDYVHHHGHRGDLIEPYWNVKICNG